MKKSRFTEQQITFALRQAEVRRLKQLEEENRQLKQLIADLSLDRQILQDAL